MKISNPLTGEGKTFAPKVEKDYKLDVEEMIDDVFDEHYEISSIMKMETPKDIADMLRSMFQESMEAHLSEFIGSLNSEWTKEKVKYYARGFFDGVEFGMALKDQEYFENDEDDIW